MKFFICFLALCFSMSTIAPACAQSSAQQNAAHMALLYAVVNRKIHDEDIQNDLQSLRENKRFIEKMQKKLDKLSNSKSTDFTNRKIREILEQAGKDIDKYL